MTYAAFTRISRKQLEATRLEAAEDLLDGIPQAKIAKKYGVSRTTASRWARALQTGGIGAMRARKGTGRPCRLTPEQLAEVEKLQSFPFTKLTGKGLAETIERTWGVHYHPDHMYKLGKPSPPPRRKLVRAVGERHDR